MGSVAADIALLVKRFRRYAVAARARLKFAAPQRRQSSTLPAVLCLLASGLLLVGLPIEAQDAGSYIDNAALFEFDGGSITASVRARRIVDLNPDIDLDNLSVPENQPGAVIAELSISNLAAEPRFAVNDPRFEIVNPLKLKDGIALNFEAEASVTLAISADASDGSRYSETFTIEVVDVNEEPFGLRIDNNFVPGGSPGDIVGSLSLTDEDLEDIHEFSIIGDDRFIIDDGVLRLADGVSLDANVDIPVTIMATDRGGLSARLVAIVTTNPANVEKEPTSATISLLQPGSQGEPVLIRAARCEPPAGFDFSEARSLQLARAGLPGELLVSVAEAYAIGDAAIIRVADQNQNIDPLIVDHVDVTLSLEDTGDREIVTLPETGEDTGVFIGYINTTSQESGANDCVLTVASRSDLVANYQDPTDATDEAETLAQISPVGIVFDDASGDPVNGIILTLIDADRDAPADVRGDGPEFALYPSAVKSGETVRDAAGFVYQQHDGEYRFPAIPDGNYRIEVFNSVAYDISSRPEEELQALPGAPFALRTGARGDVFHVQQGSIPRIDIAVRRKIENEPSMVTESRVEFLQYSPNPNVGEPVNVEETICTGGVRRPVVELRNTMMPVPGVVNLVPTKVFKAGQAIFVRVTDPDQNKDPNLREKIVIQLEVDILGEREFLELTETVPDSGQFVGYVQSTEEETLVADCAMSVAKDSIIRTVYTDAFDNTDESESTALVDPFGILFSTFDGAPVDGVTVTLIDVETGEPARVYGDGPRFAEYPATVESGGSVTDAAGREYDFPPGEYRFPFVEPGFYRLQLDNVPPEFYFPSAVPEARIQALPGAPYAIIDGSRGEEFEVPVGPALNIDLPLDIADSEIILTKSASKSTAAVGEFVQYRVSIDNVTQHGAVADITLVDLLPAGFRYKRGSMRLNDEPIADPGIGPGGRELTIELPTVIRDSHAEVSYVTEVAAGTPAGPAVNRVSVHGRRIEESNVAEHTIFITEDLMRSKSILTGRVLYGDCGSADAPGMRNIRIFLEDGTNVLTDSDGNWHVEGVKPGTHVIQVDNDSLDERYEVADCGNPNDRPWSRFVDVQGGKLWRTDFYITDAPVPTSDVSLDHRVVKQGRRYRGEIEVTVDGKAELTDLDLFFREPKGYRLVAGSTRVDGVVAEPMKTMIGKRWPLIARGNHRVTYTLEPEPVEPVMKEVGYMEVLRPRFSTRSARLTTREQRVVEAFALNLADSDIVGVEVVGHSDDVPIAPGNRDEYVDNYELSRARAAHVAALIRTQLGLPDSIVKVRGRGPDQPVADNGTADGRQMNRRVEVLYRVRERQEVESEPVIDPTEPAVARARLLFASTGTPKGKTDYVGIDLHGTDSRGRSASIAAVAEGSWDAAIETTRDEDTDGQPDELGILSHEDGELISQGVQSVRVRLDSSLLPRLYLDGRQVSNERIGITVEDPNTAKTLYAFIGIDFGRDPGEHRLKLVGVDGFGETHYEEEVTVIKTGEVAEIRFVASGDNVADGITPVTARIELLDARRRVIPTTAELTIKEGNLEPWRNENDRRTFDVKSTVTATAAGKVRFNPVDRAGRYRVVLGFNDVREEIEVLVRPASRDWILVGLGEATIGHSDIDAHMEALEPDDIEDAYYEDGRLSFYAKGKVKGEWLMTLAYDTDKEKDNSVFQKINPGTYYTLYGDASTQNYDAASNEKLYVRVERESFNAHLGDFQTNLNTTDLANYNRSLTGAYTEYVGDRVRLTAFASETTQAFVREDIQGDGTSGVYRLGERNIMRNSEQISLETRDRFHNEDIVDTVQLSRGIDYLIDYEAGTLTFKSPVFSQDMEFNPVFIVAKYETDTDGREKLTGGGRVGVVFNDQRGEVGLTAVHEGTAGREGDLAGADFGYEFSANTRLDAEVARSDAVDVNGSRQGSAWQVEFEHMSESWDAEAWFRHYDDGFGLGQQSGVQAGTRQAGASARYKVNEIVSVNLNAYRDTELATDRARDVMETSAGYATQKSSYTVGTRASRDSGGGRADATSRQLTLSAQTRMLNGKVQVRAMADKQLSASGQNPAYPTRLMLGADYQLSQKFTLTGQQEFSFGDDADTQSTRIGVAAKPWQGMNASTTLSSEETEYGPRMFANYGLKQIWSVDDHWTLDFGMDRSRVLKDGLAPLQDDQVNPNAVPIRGNESGDFTAAFAGANYRDDDWEFVSRLEGRNSDSRDQVNLTGGLKRDLRDGIVLASILDIRLSDSVDDKTSDSRLDFGFAWRPPESRWTVFERLELVYNKRKGDFDTKTSKIVNNVTVSYSWSPERQVAFQYGAKYVLDTIDTDQYSGFTDLLGVEFRQALTDRFDVGLHANRLHSRHAGAMDYGYGVSLGVRPVTNLWASVGYNFDGFRDADFDEAEYTAKGVYLKFRYKFDQDTAQQIFRGDNIFGAE